MRKKVTSSSGRERTRLVSLHRFVLFQQSVSEPVILFDNCIYCEMKVNMMASQKVFLLIYQ